MSDLGHRMKRLLPFLVAGLFVGCGEEPPPDRSEVGMDTQSLSIVDQIEKVCPEGVTAIAAENHAGYTEGWIVTCHTQAFYIENPED